MQAKPNGEGAAWGWSGCAFAGVASRPSALLAEPGKGVCALPLSEMVFDAALPGPAILHYAAKWEQDTPYCCPRTAAYLSESIQGLPEHQRARPHIDTFTRSVGVA